MKVCDLTQFYSPVSGGVKRYLKEKSAYIRNHEPGSRHIIIVPGENTECIEENGTKIYYIAGPLVSRTSRYRILTRLHIVEEILESEEPDIIESGDPYQVAWKAIASGRALDIPTVGFYHSHFPEAYIRSVAKYFGRIAISLAQEISQHYVNSLYNKFERTLVPSPALAALLRTWGVERVTNIDLGVDTAVFCPDRQRGLAERQKLGLSNDKTILLYVGRLASEKNVRTLLDAFSLLHRQGGGRFHLVIAGDGTLRGAVQRCREETGELTHISYRENGDALADLYRAADLFVHPGVQETFGLVTLETQACGTPVVGIRGSYMDRIIFSGHSHWADQNTPDSLARAILAIAERDLPELGRGASETVHSRYAWRMVFAKLFSVYRDVIAAYNI